MRAAAHPPLLLTIHRNQPYGFPDRRIELFCSISHKHPGPLCLLDSWIEVTEAKGLRIAEGRLLSTQHSLIRGALLWPEETTPATLLIPMSSSVLRHIEERRAGGDCSWTITSRARTCKVFAEPEKPEVLGVPFETFFCSSAHSDRVEHVFPQSDWIKVLRNLNWSELELTELPSVNLAGSQFGRAVKRYEEAQDFYRRGEWEECMSSCRKVFEVLVKEVSGADDMSRSEAVFQQLVSGAAVKGKLANELVKAFTPFLHLARHEQAAPVSLGPKDAMLSLHFTWSILCYLTK